MTDKDYQKQILTLLSELSDERIEWLKDVAWNLASATRKYDRFSVNDELSLKEKLILLYFEREEFLRDWEEEKKKNEEFLRETDEFIRSLKKDRASSSIKYLFPIGEA